MLPTHQGFNADQAPGFQVMHRLVVDPQLLLLQRSAQFESDFDPSLGMGRQLFGVQGVTVAPVALGLEQRSIGIAQQLFGAQRIAGKQADADTGIDEQLMTFDTKRLFERVENALGQRRGLHQLWTTFGQHRELIASESRQSDAGTEQVLQPRSHGLEQSITDVVTEAVVDHLEVIQIEHQQGAAAFLDLRRGQRLFGAVAEQQAIGQIGQRIVVSEVLEFMLGVLDRTDVGEHRHIVAKAPLIIVYDADGLPLRIDFAAFTAVPDLTAPLAPAMPAWRTSPDRNPANDGQT